MQGGGGEPVGAYMHFLVPRIFFKNLKLKILVKANEMHAVLDLMQF